MENNKALLSVIIPVYNADRYISECLESIIKVSSHDIEVVVIDDGSTDNSKQIIEEYAVRDTRIRYIRQNNGGVSAARNNGLENASGEYILFLDADDYLETEVFYELVSSIGVDTPDFTAYSKKILYPDGRVKDVYYDFGDNTCSDSKYIFELMYASSSFNECWGKIFKKDIIDKYHLRFPRNIKIGEDLLFVYEYFEKCNSFKLVNKCLLVYRQHADSAMRKSITDDRLKITDMLYTAGQKYLDEIGNQDLRNKADTYYFRVLTNLCREYGALQDSRRSIEMIYRSEVTQKIMEKLSIKKIPLYKRHEYLLMKFKFIKLSAMYYGLKARA